MLSIKEKDNKYITGTYNRFPVVITHGKGAIAYGEDGKEYIDMESGYGTNSFGFCDDEWLAAVTAQLQKVQHTSNLYYTEPTADLAEMLCQRTGMKTAFFANSGGEANECALKAARKYGHTHKGDDCYTIISMKNSFHGRGFGAVTATGIESDHRGFEPLVPGFVYADFNDIDSVKQLVSDNKTAAIIVECVQGEGGVNVMTPEFAAGLQKICSDNDILLICDEVQCGNGRTGTLYAYEQLGLHPDIVTTAKGIGGGLPIGVCMFGEKADGTLVPGDHGTTFGGNPVACAGAISILSRMDEVFLADVRRKSKIVFDALEGTPGVARVDGLGLMIGIVPSEKPAGEIVNECLEKGVLCITAGSGGSQKVRLLPPLTITDEQLVKALEIIRSCLA